MFTRLNENISIMFGFHKLTVRKLQLENIEHQCYPPQGKRNQRPIQAEAVHYELGLLSFYRKSTCFFILTDGLPL